MNHIYVIFIVIYTQHIYLYMIYNMIIYVQPKSSEPSIYIYYLYRFILIYTYHIYIYSLHISYIIHISWADHRSKFRTFPGEGAAGGTPGSHGRVLCLGPNGLWTRVALGEGGGTGKSPKNGGSFMDFTSKNGNVHGFIWEKMWIFIDFNGNM